MSNNVEIIKANPLVTRRNDNSGSLSRRVAAYCRVSSDSDDQKNSYDSQVRHYREYISQHQDWILVDIYADEGISGTQVGKRQDFQRLISDCLDGKIDYIITKAIARFARNTLDTLKYVRLLKDKQIGVFFEEENIDTLTMDGELLLTILSSVAQQEVENTSAHVKKGLKMKMQRGELIGFQGCLGYDYNQDTKSISINEKEAKIVRYIFERYIDGIGGRAIARELDELGYKTPRGLDHWQDTTVLGIIKNEKYKGDILMGKTFTVDPISKRRLINFGEEDKYYIKNNHDAIISPEIFTQAQEIRLRRSGNKKTIANTKGKRERYSRMYPFSSRLECGFCGTVLSRRSWHSSSEYKKIIWHCTTSIKRGKKYCTHSKGIEEKAIENAFLQSYQQLFYENNNLTEDFLEIIKEELTDDTLKVELTKIVSKLNSLYKKEEKLVSMNLDGKISDSVYEDKFNQIQIEKEKLLEEKVNLPEWWNEELARRDVLFFSYQLDKSSILEFLNKANFHNEIVHIGNHAVFWGKFDEAEYLKTTYHKQLLKQNFYKMITIRNGNTFEKIAQILETEK